MGFLADRKLSISYFAKQAEEICERQRAKFLFLEHASPA
jgi:hypothetical protein